MARRRPAPQPLSPRRSRAAAGAAASHPTGLREGRPPAVSLYLALATEDTPLSPTADTDTEQRQAVLARLREEQARQVLTIGAVRAHLEEQPSARSVRACARMWCSDITNLAETVIKARNSTETE